MFCTVDVSPMQNIDENLLTMPADEQEAVKAEIIQLDEYIDIRGIGLDEAKFAVKEEAELLEKIAAAPSENQGDWLDEVEYELYEEFSPLAPYDLGIAGILNALSYIGCFPINSCNGGLLGGNHEQHLPRIIFYAPLSTLPLLKDAAKKADVGIVNGEVGTAEIYSGDLRKFNKMAADLISR